MTTTQLILLSDLLYLFSISLSISYLFFWLPITLAIGKGSFSKLKLIKKLFKVFSKTGAHVNIVLLNIEPQCVEDLNLNKVIRDFLKFKI